MVSGKTPLFVIGPFHSFRIPHFIFLKISFCQFLAVSFGSVAFSIVVLSTKKGYSIFLRKVFVFQKKKQLQG